MLNKNLKTSSTILVSADKGKVWETLTNPKLIAQYLYGTEAISDWKEGCPIVFQGNYEGQSYQDKGNVLQSVPGELLKYNYWSQFSQTEDDPENYSTITLSMETKETGIIQLTWSQEGFSSEEGYKHTKEGLPNLLKQIKTIAEGL